MEFNRPKIKREEKKIIPRIIPILSALGLSDVNPHKRVKPKINIATIKYLMNEI